MDQFSDLTLEKAASVLADHVHAMPRAHIKRAADWPNVSQWFQNLSPEVRNSLMAAGAGGVAGVGVGAFAGDRRKRIRNMMLGGLLGAGAGGGGAMALQSISNLMQNMPESQRKPERIAELSGLRQTNQATPKDVEELAKLRAPAASAPGQPTPGGAAAPSILDGVQKKIEAVPDAIDAVATEGVNEGPKAAMRTAWNRTPHPVLGAGGAVAGSVIGKAVDKIRAARGTASDIAANRNATTAQEGVARSNYNSRPEEAARIQALKKPEMASMLPKGTKMPEALSEAQRVGEHFMHNRTGKQIPIPVGQRQRLLSAANRAQPFVAPKPLDPPAPRKVGKAGKIGGGLAGFILPQFLPSGAQVPAADQ